MSGLIGTRGFRTALVVALAAAMALVLTLLVLTDPAEAGSTDLRVTKTADTNDGACTLSDCSLREAVIYANTFGADSIEIPAGTYTLTLTGSGEDNAATGDLDIRRGVSIRSDGSAGARDTTIDGGGIDRVFHTPYQNTSTPFHVNIFGLKVTGGNVTGPGGGIFHDADDATLNLSNSTVSGNNADSGGGIMAQRGPLNVSRSTISKNNAPDGQGGGILIGSGATSTITNTTVSGNESRFGGGVDTYAPVRITDSTVAFNTAQQPGGGLHVGGGAGPFTLKNTIVSNNKSDFPTSKNCDRADFVDSEGNNLENGTSCGLDQTTDLNASPRLGDLANNGGPTNTHALPVDSPAIDAGGDPFPPTDQRSVARPQGIANDIGAYEKEQNLNVVLCPTGGSGSDECVGTSARDVLVGRDGTYDQIQGGEGNDAYNGKGGCDSWIDSSLKSRDRYLISVEDFCNIGISTLSIRDDGGKEDVLDLSRFYASTDFEFSIGYTNLHMDGPGNNNIDILDFFTPDSGATDSIEFFVFSDKTLSAKKIRKTVV